MNKATKSVEISKIKENFDKMTSAVLLDFTGMNVEQLTKLRTEFRKVGVEYKVVKNTLVKQALKKLVYQDKVNSILSGMTGIAWSYEDPSAAAKVIKEFKKTSIGDKLKVKAGLIDNSVLDPKAVEDQLATMPGKNELRATLLATLQAPLQGLVVLLQAPAQNLVYLMVQKSEKGDAE